MSDPGGERQVPFHCPYCGEEDLVPAGERPGDWSCRSCGRGFALRFTGLTRTDLEESR
jgi:transcription elongation factor Elf1